MDWKYAIKPINNPGIRKRSNRTIPNKTEKQREKMLMICPALAIPLFGSSFNALIPKISPIIANINPPNGTIRLLTLKTSEVIARPSFEEFKKL